MIRSFFSGAALGVVALTAPHIALATPAALIGSPEATRAVSFRVTLPLRNQAELEDLVRLQTSPSSPLYHHFLSVAQFRAAYGPTPATIGRAAAALTARGFSVARQTSQGLEVRGTAGSVAAAFGTTLAIEAQTNGANRVSSGTELAIPVELRALGANVSGFERGTRVHLNSRIAATPLNRRRPNGGYYFTDLKQAYAYPSDTAFNGKGATVGVLMSSDVLDSDTLNQFFHEQYTNIAKRYPLPLFRRPVLGGAPFGGINSGASDEASIDVQTSLTSAPGAQAVLYNIPSLTDDAIMAGYTDVDEDNIVDVLSSSFGGCELAYFASYNAGRDYTYLLKNYHNLFLQGNVQGISFLASSGDEAGLECPNIAYFTGGTGPKFVPSVGSPADDPNVTAVGGTNLETTPPSSNPKILTSKYVSENSYGDAELPQDPYGTGATLTNGEWGSGSGTSAYFAKPAYQKLVSTPSATMRTIPDISMQMGGCPGGISILPCHPTDSYSDYFIGGKQYGFIGTSLSSPEFAGVLAIEVGATKSRLGNVNNYIYAVAAAEAKLPAGGSFHYLHQGIPGFNGVVTTKAGSRGYDPIIGVGTPYTANFLGLSKYPLAGDPQTISNP